MNKKSQYAMEFLMTYGWAILVVIAMVGALAYFGVFNPDNFLPIDEENCEEICKKLGYDECTFRGEFKSSVECKKIYNITVNEISTIISKEDKFFIKQNDS